MTRSATFLLALLLPVTAAAADPATVVVHAGRPKKSTKIPSFSWVFWSMTMATTPPPRIVAMIWERALFL